ncbi:MAG: FixH family protein [Bacteroidetes bacterium]|nr:FixH family protein [Bacteroidota bacterium]
MKIKMNWGKGLALGMGIFMLFIIAMGAYMFRQSPDDYDHQYYEKGLAYDSVYNQERQVLIDKVQPKITVGNNAVAVDFAAPAAGTVQFERLADPSLDREVAFSTDAGYKVNIDAGHFRKGRWDLTFSWQNAGKKYLYQQKIDLK